MGQEGLTLAVRSLCRSARKAVLAVVERRHPEALRRLSIEEVIRVGKVLEPGKPADLRRDLAGEKVMSHIQLLQTQHPGNGARQRPDELVEADVKNSEAFEQADLRR